MLGDILTEIKGIKESKTEQTIAPIPETDPIDTASGTQVLYLGGRCPVG